VEADGNFVDKHYKDGTAAAAGHDRLP
jgi:hypothetical protein